MKYNRISRDLVRGDPVGVKTPLPQKPQFFIDKIKIDKQIFDSYYVFLTKSKPTKLISKRELELVSGIASGFPHPPIFKVKPLSCSGVTYDVLDEREIPSFISSLSC